MTKELIDLAWSCLPKEFKEEVKKVARIYSGRTSALFGAERHLANKFLDEFIGLFGLNNLTSDAEGEDEMLTVSRKKVQEEYAVISKELSHRDTDAEDYIAWNYVKMTFEEFYGSKCLPDNACNVASNGASSEPKFKVGDKVRILSLHGSPTPDNGVVDVIAHINKGNRKQMYYLENHYHCAFGFSESDLEPCTELEETFTDNRKSQCESQYANFSQDFANCDKCLKSGQNTHPDFGHSRLTIAAMAMQGLLANPNNNASLRETIADALNCADALLHEVEKGGSK